MSHLVRVLFQLHSISKQKDMNLSAHVLLLYEIDFVTFIR